MKLKKKIGYSIILGLLSPFVIAIFYGLFIQPFVWLLSKEREIVILGLGVLGFYAFLSLLWLGFWLVENGD